MLLDSEVYRRIKAVDVAPLVDVLESMEFIDSGGVCAWVTKAGQKAPQEMIDLLLSLGLGGTFYRPFLRMLVPGQNIAPHTDAWEGLPEGMRRFHVPLITHPDCFMRWPDDDVQLHLEKGWLYEVRFDRTHEVINDTPSKRIHMQIDQVGATI